MTTTEEVIRLTREVADASLNDPVVGSSIVLDIGEMKRLIKLVKAEENEAIIAAANALENIASTSSSTRFNPRSPLPGSEALRQLQMSLSTRVLRRSYPAYQIAPLSPA